MKCAFCEREITNAMPCRSTRDMEDAVISGHTLSDECLTALEKVGGGERGIDRVLALRDEQLQRWSGNNGEA